MGLIVRYVLKEACLLKFAVETLFLKKKHFNQTASLLEFFKKNCFFRDYIYLWQTWVGSKHTSGSESNTSHHLRFTLALNAPTQIRSDQVVTDSVLSLKVLNYENVAQNSFRQASHLISNILSIKILSYLTTLFNKSFSFGFFYIQGFAFILFIDACLTDDEPL
jgi:hypothetical protein